MAKKKVKTQSSTVCRVNKNSNYTVMSNFHLRSKNMSLKAIGLLSKILSLTDEWDYSVAGLTSICKEGETTIKTALAELKEWGYLHIEKLMPNQTKSGRIEYVYDFYEYSAKDDPSSPEYKVVSPKKAAGQEVEKQGIEILPLEIQAVENQGQLNTNNQILKNQVLSNQVSTNQSISESETAEPLVKKTDKQIDRYLQEQQIYTEIVRQNIGYSDYADWIRLFVKDSSMSTEELDEIIGIIVRAICSRKKTDIICGQEYPREVIKSAMLRVDRTCVENALETMRQTDDIRNYEKYLISTLFNEANGRHFKDNAVQRNIDYAVRRDFHKTY